MSLVSFLHSTTGQNILSLRLLIPASVRHFASKSEKGKIEVEKDVKLYWEKHGHGPHPVLFLPGLGGAFLIRQIKRSVG